MIRKKYLPTLLTLPMFFMACGDDSSSSSAPSANMGSCVIEQNWMSETGSFTSKKFCIETDGSEAAKKIMDGFCHNDFSHFRENKVKNISTCPTGQKKTCTRKGDDGNEVTYYFYESDSKTKDCEKLIDELIDQNDSDELDSNNIYAFFESEDPEKIDLDKMTDNEKEFENVYQLLNYHYLFAHTDSLVPNGTPWYKPLSKRSAYKGKGKGNMPADLKKYDIPFEMQDAVFMTRSLNDGYSEYTPPQVKDYEEYIEEFEMRQPLFNAGLYLKAIKVNEDSLAFVVNQVANGSAAREVGMKSNDTIVSISGIKAKSFNEFVKILNEYETKKTDYVVARTENGKRVEKKFTVNPHEYLPPSVYYSVNDSIAFIQITDFSSNYTATKGGTYEEFLEALKETENTKATIIDLRENGGGDGEQCEAISKTMAHKNDTLAIDVYGLHDMQTNQPVWAMKPTIADEDGIASDRYIVFLANENTGSCAEFTLMGVTIAKKSPIVGTRTFGKGSGYAIERTYMNGTLQFTLEMIIDKNKETYHMHGILPDIEEDDPDQQELIAIKIANEGTMKRSKGYGEDVLPDFQQNVYAKKSDISHKTTRADLGMYRKFNSKEDFDKYINR